MICSLQTWSLLRAFISTSHKRHQMTTSNVNPTYSCLKNKNSGGLRGGAGVPFRQKIFHSGGEFSEKKSGQKIIDNQVSLKKTTPMNPPPPPPRRPLLKFEHLIKKSWIHLRLSSTLKTYNRMKLTKYATCAILLRFHILYILEVKTIKYQGPVA